MENTENLRIVRKGRYIIDVTAGQLYFREINSQKRTPIGNSGVWTRARCIAADDHWLYIVDNGNLFQVNPQTGNSCQIGDFRAGLQRSIWFDHGWLYAVQRTDLTGDDTMIFAEIWRLKPNNSDVKKRVAKRVRMDLPGIQDSFDTEVYLDIS